MKRDILVGLDAAKRLDLAVLLGCAHNFGSALANVVSEQVDRGQRAAEKSNEIGTTHAKRQQTFETHFSLRN